MSRDTLESFMRIAPGVWLQIDGALRDETTITVPSDPKATSIVRASAEGDGLVTRAWRAVPAGDVVTLELPAAPAPESPLAGERDVGVGSTFAWSKGARGPYRLQIELDLWSTGTIDGELLMRAKGHLARLVVHTEARSERLADLAALGVSFLGDAPHAWRIEQESDVRQLDDYLAETPPLVDLPEPTRLGSGKRGRAFVAR